MISLRTIANGYGHLWHYYLSVHVICALLLLLSLPLLLYSSGYHMNSCKYYLYIIVMIRSDTVLFSL